MPDRIAMDSKMIRLEYARRLINDNKLNEALEVLYQLIKDYPNEESILFELGKVYSFQNKHNKSIEYFEMLSDSENFKDMVYDMLINEYNELNENLKIFNLYKRIQKENRIIRDDNKKNNVIYAIRKLKKYDEDIFELLSDNKEEVRKFYFYFVSDTLESLKKETNFYAKFKIYKNAINILKNKVNILIDLEKIKKYQHLFILI